MFGGRGMVVSSFRRPAKELPLLFASLPVWGQYSPLSALLKFKLSVLFVGVLRGGILVSLRPGAITLHVAIF